MTISKTHRPLWRLTPAAWAAAMCTCLSASAWAQEAATLERIEITGTSIKRVQAEGALPVQVINRESIAKAGATTAAELLGKISASAGNLTDGASFSDIAGQRGFNGANLRGLGVSSTLVLLNGRRLANFASPGAASGVDLNSIPSAAIERVEVLKDGASAIYGTDAIGGVINFITRRDYRGADIYAYHAGTQHGGAGKSIATLSGGMGDLDKDGYNVFAVLDFQDTKTLRSTQRDWIRGAFVPEENLDVASSNTWPANFRRLNSAGRPTGSRLNPSAPACNPPATLYDPLSFVGDRACYYDYMQDTEIFPASKRSSALTRGQWRLNADHTVFAEALYAKTETQYRISPLTVTNLDYPAAGQYYPTGMGVTGPLRVNMRLTEAGGRTNDVSATAKRLLVGAKGVFGAWDYDGAINHSVNDVADAYTGGYVLTQAFDTAFKSGVINPFGVSGPAGLAALEAARVNDKARQSSGTTDSVDFKITRDLWQLDGGPVGVAIGVESRREKMSFTPSALLASGQIRSEGTATAFGGDRTVNAVFSELNVPVTKTLETQLALRHDRYNDVGSSTNPKVGMRWSPSREFMVRASYGTGFRAPSLSDLYSPTRIGQTNGIYDDPLGCAYVKANAPDFEPDYCGLQPDKLQGGSPDLKPEKSKQASVGLVFEPAKWVSGSVDLFRIEKSDVIVAPEGVLLANPDFYAAYIQRDAALPGLPASVPAPITQVDSRLRNIGGLQTTGIDLSLDLRAPATSFGTFSASLNGTYVLDYETQEGAGAPWVKAVGVFANDQVIQRWRHTLGVEWNQGPWNATLTQTFYRGHRDQNPMPDGTPRRVGDYSLFDLTASWTPSKAWKVRAGVKNLLDTNPPFSNQIYSFLASYDPSYTDPRGRLFFASVQYSFR